ncbi:hypothetical protein H4219_002505 [Mycoemilia scoparia]|uniref:Roadblock/LAMTOR2 domain-containing protein n=1 Tax=Mycoemilia scoparia TaxID=417184 RepID=A0A9W7ZXF0_9FUNG|nr:hypothetical protein H4219_002505 [Mycoemilia scoparia]
MINPTDFSAVLKQIITSDIQLCILFNRDGRIVTSAKADDFSFRKLRLKATKNDPGLADQARARKYPDDDFDYEDNDGNNPDSTEPTLLFMSKKKLPETKVVGESLVAGGRGSGIRGMQGLRGPSGAAVGSNGSGGDPDAAEATFSTSLEGEDVVGGTDSDKPKANEAEDGGDDGLEGIRPNVSDQPQKKKMSYLDQLNRGVVVLDHDKYTELYGPLKTSSSRGNDAEHTNQDNGSSDSKTHNGDTGITTSPKPKKETNGMRALGRVVRPAGGSSGGNVLTNKAGKPGMLATNGIKQGDDGLDTQVPSSPTESIKIMPDGTRVRMIPDTTNVNSLHEYLVEDSIAAANIWRSYDQMGRMLEGSDMVGYRNELNLVMTECQYGMLAIVPVYDLLLFVLGTDKVNIGMLHSKTRALVNYLEELLHDIKI